jgi:DNA-directed RNA polymerase specialized sigma24 family protein
MNPHTAPAQPQAQPQGAWANPEEPTAPSALGLSALVSRCQIETDHFYAGRPHDPRFAYELFRRALADRNEAAWIELYALYRPLVEGWIKRSGSLPLTGEHCETFVSAAFARLWRAIPPARLSDFPTLAALLNYLQRCAGCVVIDYARSQPSAALPEEALAHARELLVSPDEQALVRVEREEFWRLIDGLLHSEAERAVVQGAFVLGMKPGDIFERHPDLFESVNSVYAVKRNVLTRLGRNPELRRLAQ